MHATKIVHCSSEQLCVCGGAEGCSPPSPQAECLNADTGSPEDLGLFGLRPFISRTPLDLARAMWLPVTALHCLNSLFFVW